MYDFYIFDLDGTLLDTLDDLADSVNATLHHFSYPLRTLDEIRKFVGNGMRNLIQLSLGGIPENFENILAYFKKYYGENCEKKTKPYEGIIEVLQYLKSQGKKTAIVSNKADYATQVLSKNYFNGLIDFTIGENEQAGVRRKPFPDSVLKAMDFFGAKKENTVYIGDSETDIQTAKNAGLRCISVVWGFRDKEYLIKEGATKIITKPSELINL